MIVVQDRRALIQLLSVAADRLIAIDGWYGSGKSWLGRSAGRCMGRTWLDLDRLLERRQDAFVDHLDLLAVKDAVYGCKPVILSGVCMKGVLARIGSPCAVHVYVKRMHLGYWTHQEEAEGRGHELDESFPPSALEREVRAYHDIFKPHETASYIYERTVNSAGL